MGSKGVDELRLYEQLYLIRRFEERTAELFKEGLIVGTAHSCIGQEATAVGAAAALRDGDRIVGNHRSHGHLIARGASIERMMAELMGRQSGYCRGLGGSMHIADVGLGILGCNGIVGAGLAIGCGSALTTDVLGGDEITVVFFGDGAASQGVAHESFNLAAVWSLPVVFVCENNQYALSTEWRESRPIEDVADRAASYAMPGEIVDGNDVYAVQGAVSEAAARARRGEGPSLIEAKTYRVLGHSVRTNIADERDPDVVKAWAQRDPLAQFEHHVLAGGVGRDAIETLRNDVDTQLEAAIEEAQTEPVLQFDDLSGLTYASPKSPSEPPPVTERQLGFAEAIREALEQEMEADETVVVFGEDVAVGGLFGATAGLLQRFGPSRIRNTPISEGGFVGAAVGASMTGLRPVVEIQIFDFVTLAMDPLVNQAAKMRFMTGGAASVPLVVRGPAGGGLRLAAQHSQSLEAWFAHVPGLKVVAPSNPADAKGLLAASIQDDNPVVFVETKSLLFSEGPVPEERYATPLGEAAVVRGGTDVTVVATQALVPAALRAAHHLESENTSIEVVDLRTIYPLDLPTILESVAKTSRLVIAHEATMFGGIGAEIAASVALEGFWDLDAPITRVAAPHIPIPYEKTLELQTLPDADRIIGAVRATLRT